MANRKPNNSKLRTVLLIVVAGMAVIGLRIHDINRQQTASIPRYETVNPFRGTFVRTVPIAGEIRNYQPIIVHSDVRSWERPRVIEMVQPGAFVKKGDPVMILDASEFRQRLSKPTLAVIADNARYDKAQADEIIQDGTNARRTAASHFNANQAKAALESYEKGDYVNKQAELQGGIKRRRQEFEMALANFLETQRLARVGIESNTAVAAANRQLEKTEISLNLANSDVVFHEQFQHPRNMAQMEMTTQDAVDEIHRTEQRNELETAIKKTWTLSFNRWRGGWQSQVDYWQSCIDACIVRAPKDGQVMYLNEHDKTITIGETVHYNQKLFTVSERTRLSMAGRVSDRHFFSLRHQQSAVVSVAALADKTFTGKLTWMGTIPTLLNRFAPESKHHKLEILLDGRGKTIANLYPGMTATAEIIVDAREHVLQLPTSAVVQHEGQYVVILQRQRGLVCKVVEVGAADDDYTEILSGLDVTDDVVVALPETLRELARAHQ